MTFSKSQKHGNLRHRGVMLNTPRRQTLSTSVTATCTWLIELQNPQGLEREKPSTNTHHFSTPPIWKVFVSYFHDNLHLATQLSPPWTVWHHTLWMRTSTVQLFHWNSLEKEITDKSNHRCSTPKVLQRSSVTDC